MTKLLEQALDRIRTLPPAGQDEMARILLRLVGEEGSIYALTPEEEGLLRAHPYVWGCDLCQTACPYNQSPKLAPLPEFEADYLPSLTLKDLEGLTNRAFKEQFGHRPFAWRGPAPFPFLMPPPEVSWRTRTMPPVRPAMAGA